MPNDKSDKKHKVKNKNEGSGNYPQDQMIEFTSEQMSVSGNRLIVEGKENLRSYNPIIDNERELRSISGSLAETDESIDDN